MDSPLRASVKEASKEVFFISGTTLSRILPPFRFRAMDSAVQGMTNLGAVLDFKLRSQTI